MGSQEDICGSDVTNDELSGCGGGYMHMRMHTHADTHASTHVIHSTIRAPQFATPPSHL